MIGKTIVAAALAALLAHLWAERGARTVDGLQTAIRHSGVLRGATPAHLAEVLPPEQFQGEAAAIIIWGSPETMKALCGEQNIACAGATENGAPIIAMPNPCPFKQNLYAVIECHEKGHVLGWPGEHGV